MTSDFEPPVVGLRRPPELQPRPDPGHEPALLARIVAEIQSGGPMTFARFMELALYAPDHGYYAGGRGGPGREADFLTAPESHPLFGWAVARQLEEIWDRLGRPARFTVREHGAGTGALAAGIVEGLQRAGSPLLPALRYRIVERAPDREQLARERLAGLGAADVLERDDGSPVVGAVLANEVLDALPVQRVVGGPDGSLLESYVELDDAGTFTTVDGSPSTEALLGRLAAEGVQLELGQRAEICLPVDDWVASAAAGLARGILLLIDYGHPAAALYAPSRGSLLRAYLQHRVHGDPYANIGRQDLTAHVDLTAVENAAAKAGLDHLGTTRQAAFLAGLGVGDLLVGLQSGSGATLEAYLHARSALLRMLDSSATGGFAVLVFGRDLPLEPPIRGLSIPPLTRG